MEVLTLFLTPLARKWCIYCMSSHQLAGAFHTSWWPRVAAWVHSRQILTPWWNRMILPNAYTENR